MCPFQTSPRFVQPQVAADVEEQGLWVVARQIDVDVEQQRRLS